jgi:TonB family protein
VRYTDQARNNAITGTVALGLLFTADGRVIVEKVIRELPDGLTEQAIEAAQKMRFKPAMKDGVAVNVRLTLEYTFGLPGR